MQDVNNALQSLPDIEDFLFAVKLDRYTSLFQRHDIETRELFSMNDLELEKLGIESTGHRKRLIEAVAQYRIEIKNKKAEQERSESKELTKKILTGYIIFSFFIAIILQVTITEKSLTDTFWLLDGLLIAAALCAFMIPSIIAWWRGVEFKWWILIANVFLGGTGLGWVACFFFSLSKIDHDAAKFFIDKASKLKSNKKQ